MRRLSFGMMCAVSFTASVFAGTAAEGSGRAVQEAQAAVHQALLEAERKSVRSASVDKVRISWPLLPGAVRYRVVLLSSPEYDEENVIYAETVPASGTEILLSALHGAPVEETYWAVCGLRLGGEPAGDFSAPRPLAAGERCPVSPMIMSDYALMAEPPIYLVYAWVPVHGASSYEIEVWRGDGRHGERVRHYYTYDTVLYDETPILGTGEYSWRVRALDGHGRRWSDWSTPERFTVHAPVTVAAFGDSITHGGGAMTAPPSRAMYAWESYTGISIKNLGRSGDTTYELLQRFESDVLPFAPKYLIIMGGVNDYRIGTSARVTIQNLSLLADECCAHGITPIFTTTTPIAPHLMDKVADVEAAAQGWKAEMRAVNEWIMAQPYAVDVSTPLTDENGELKETLTTDGLHPDAEAKRIIGERVGAYLRETFGLR
ncbi:MAG: SGNH/GDSL hydrolase family protein [Schwartzia sp.]|nr:SGNH/GDSL hydrolase family protein [Schwartzia sp. (in: firmicutes)]